MSSMLEEAIIDAEALKAAALKNAETQVLERYQQEVSRAVTDILEQEDEEEMGAEDDMGMDMGGDDMGMDLGGDMGMDMGGGEESHEELAGQIAAQLPPAALGIDVVPTDMPVAADPDDPEAAPAEKEIVIDLDAIIAQAEEEAEGEEAGEVGLGMEPPPEDDLGMGDEEEPLFEIDFGEDEFTISESDLTNLIKDISEELTVDYTPVASGALGGTNRAELADAEEVAIAAERDTEAEEEREEQEKALKDLQEVLSLTRQNLKESKKARKGAETKLAKLEAISNKLMEELEAATLTNTKLFYINEVLKNRQLNVKQREQLSEALSQAESGDHAKMIYETLKKTLNSSTTKRDSKRSLNEVVSKPASHLPRRNREVKNELRFADRMKRLAGIE